MNDAAPPPKNRRERRALRAQGRLRAISGGKPVAPSRVLAPNTPAQNFGHALEEFVAGYLKKHSGLDAMNVTKVILQYSASSAIDFGAGKEDYIRACGDIFDEERNARG